MRVILYQTPEHPRGNTKSLLLRGSRRRRSPPMQILQRRHIRTVTSHRPHPSRRRTSRRKSSNARNVVTNRRPPNRLLVVKRFSPQRRVNHQIHLSRLDQIHNVRPPLIHLIHRLHFNPRASKSRRRPPSSHHLQSRRQQILHHKRHMSLVMIVHAQKHSPRLRQPLPRRQLRLCERQPESRRNPHHLARRTHLRPQNRIHAAKLVKRKHRRFHRIKIPHRQFLNPVRLRIRQMQIAQFSPSHQTRRHFRQGYARRLTHIRNRSRSPRIHFQHINRVALNRILHVHQPHHFQRSRQP